MTTAVKPVYEDGVFKPKEPVRLKEKTEVEVLIPEEARKQDDEDPTGWKTARELISCITEKPIAPNISEDHDRYIYRK
jgi:predicted DNA-binding antitoxin AbrB/MazE fold protein